MWIIDSTPPEAFSNSPSDAIAETLRKKAGPGVPLYRTEEAVFADFAALAYAQELVSGPEVPVTQPVLDPETGEPVLGEGGEPLTETVMVPGPRERAPVGNTWQVEEGAYPGLYVAVVRSLLGDVLGSWPLLPVL